MSYKRALWSSGYTYRIRCPYCGTQISYTDKNLGYRAWYPNGFVYCPTCQKPLRHNEIYAVDANGNPVYKTEEEANQAIHIGYMRAMGYPADQQTFSTPAGNAASDDVLYCVKCGRPYHPGSDRFCSGCGNKLD